MTAECTRGLLIAVEGCDRSGKSTQCRLLQQHLASIHRPAECIKFPDRSTAIGAIIDQYLTGCVHLGDEAVHLLFSANRWELVERIESALAAGTSVVLDRYVYSGVAYTAAKVLSSLPLCCALSKGLDICWCKAPDRGLPKPDLVIFIDLPSAVAEARLGYGQERYEQSEFQRRVRLAFGQLADHAAWSFVNGDDSIDGLAARIQKAVSSLLAVRGPTSAPVSRIDW